MKSSVYACYLKNEEQLRRSSSGGAYTAISNVILNQNGSIIACSYNYETHTMEFVAISDGISRDNSRGSKYVQADASALYQLLQNEFKRMDGSPLMVVGKTMDED